VNYITADGLSGFSITPDGLYMIPVGENGIENKIVYTDGDWESPFIEKVVEIKLTDEISLDIVRGFIYESKGIIDYNYFEGLLENYDAETFQYGTQRNGSESSEANNTRLGNGAGTSDEIRRSRRIIDSDGVLLTEEQAEYFKDSKIRDENGNLLVLYHGSKADAMVFKEEFISP